jgi:beta-xylosidase
MYYSANEHVCVAVADHPLGPFVQPEKKPFFENEKTIDNTLFIDDDGKPYMFFDRFHDGLNIWSVELEDDCLHAKPESYRYCIRAYQPWERKLGKVNEGCFVIKYKGRYYMTYSGNGYTSQEYGIGCAVADNIGGLWKKYDHNPILQKCGNLVGVGHHSFFKDKDGKLRIVFHAHNSVEKIHPRHMYIGTAWFKEEEGKVPELVIDKEYITPVIAE